MLERILHNFVNLDRNEDDDPNIDNLHNFHNFHILDLYNN